MGLAAVVLVTAVGASVTKVPMLFASPTYYGQFSDTGGLMVGDYVRIDGVNVGTVKDMDTLAQLGADHMMSSVIYGDTAYEVVNGFLGEPEP